MQTGNAFLTRKNIFIEQFTVIFIIALGMFNEAY